MPRKSGRQSFTAASPLEEHHRPNGGGNTDLKSQSRNGGAHSRAHAELPANSQGTGLALLAGTLGGQYDALGSCRPYGWSRVRVRDGASQAQGAGGEIMPTGAGDRR